jgi:hypothetical protein
MEQLQAFDGGTCGTSDLTDVLGVAVSPAPIGSCQKIIRPRWIAT